MPLVLLIGGARSGKSALAARMAAAQPAPVVLLATAEPGDEEMALRIARHKRARPASWKTVEEPLALAEAIAGVPAQHCLIVDCLTLWTANMLSARGAAAAADEAARAAARANGRVGLTVVVTNEVGLGVVPEHPLGREYRDLLGRVNTVWATAATQAYLLIAGRALALTPGESLVEGLM